MDVQTCLARLTPLERITLIDLADRPPIMVAVAHGVTRNAIYQRRYRASQRLGFALQPTSPRGRRSNLPSPPMLAPAGCASPAGAGWLFDDSDEAET